MGRRSTPWVEKGKKFGQQDIGHFFLQGVAAVESSAPDIGGLVAPSGEHVVEQADGAFGPPQRQQRRPHPAVGIRRVMLEIDGGSGAVVFADGMAGGEPPQSTLAI